MMDCQDFICKKCGKVILRTASTNYCSYCGEKLPELKEMPKICCPLCGGTGLVDVQTVQPFSPAPQYFNVMTNAEQEDV